MNLKIVNLDELIKRSELGADGIVGLKVILEVIPETNTKVRDGDVLNAIIDFIESNCLIDDYDYFLFKFENQFDNFRNEETILNYEFTIISLEG